MKTDRLKRLLQAAARHEPHAGAQDLPEQVLRAVRREEIEPAPTVFDQLGDLMPRAALAAALVVVTCVAVEAFATGDLSADVVQLSEQWLFAAN